MVAGTRVWLWLSPFLFQQKEPPSKARGGGWVGLRLEEATRRGRARGRATGEPKASLPGSVSQARPRAATVCTQCAFGLRLAPLQLTLHCSLSQKPRSRGGSGSSVSRSHCWLLRPRCAHGSRGARNPGSPSSARCASARTHPQRRLNPSSSLAHPPPRTQAQSKLGGTPFLSGPSLFITLPREFVWRSSAGRRHPLESLTGAGSTAVLQSHLAYSALHYDPGPARVTSARWNHEALGSCLAFGWTQPRCPPVRQR